MTAHHRFDEEETSLLSYQQGNAILRQQRGEQHRADDKEADVLSSYLQGNSIGRPQREDKKLGNILSGVFLLGGCALAVVLVHAVLQTNPEQRANIGVTDKVAHHDPLSSVHVPLEGISREHHRHKKHKYKKGKKHHTDHQAQIAQEPLDSDSADFGIDEDIMETPFNSSLWKIPQPTKRCDFVMARFAERDHGVPLDELKERYKVQSTSPNVFYRATAHIFWQDFVNFGWGSGLTTLGDTALLKGGVKISKKATWTWVTGDQHLSNFGAWRNRHEDVVFGVNDFDEAAIYDFHVDVLRIAVSVANHASYNKLSDKDVHMILKSFCHQYVTTVINYVGNEHALLWELRNKTAYGSLLNFIKSVENDNSYGKLMTKFTDVDKDTGRRYFLKGEQGQPFKDTRLMAVSPEREQEIRDAFTSTKYGATMMKLGWAAFSDWRPDFFEVLDVAARVGSGIGSLGSARYYVLLKGNDGLLGNEGVDGTAIVLDVKYEPPGAVSRVLSLDEAAWYKQLFPHEAVRVIEAQRRLTSFTDPYTGWITLKDADGNPQSFSVRQRSPWKDSFNLDTLTDPQDFKDFMDQIAASTATSHVRGSVAKRPGDFKHVIRAILWDLKKRNEWAEAVVHVAHEYRQQVLLDFECFKDYVQHNMTGSSS
jgi:uncharacterized protein (DUF2252 family)